MADRINRRQAVALGGALAIGGLAGALPAEAATWQLRWSPEAGRAAASPPSASAPPRATARRRLCTAMTPPQLETSK